MVLESILEFAIRNKFVILFYAGVFLFVYLNRSKFEIHAKFIALYKTTWGISLMDRIAGRHRELIKLLGYISIGAGFIGMAFIVFFLVMSIFTVITQPEAPPPLAPILPGVRIPGVDFFVPLVQGIIAIFIVAVMHEFSHGVVARAHGVTVKKTGPAIVGPFFAAFVEPDENELKKKEDIVNYSIVAAGPASNILFGFLLLTLLGSAIVPLIDLAYPPAGISFPSITPESPAEKAGVDGNVTYTYFNGERISSSADFLQEFASLKPGDTVEISNDEMSKTIVLSEHPTGEGAYMGVNIENTRKGEDGVSYAIVSWFQILLVMIAVLSLGIGTANLIPVGPLDGGKMLQQALQKIRGEKKGNKTLVKVSLILLLVILFLMTPVLRETGKAIFG